MVRDGTRTVAVLPFCIERFWPALTLARLAGVDTNFAVVGLPIMAGYEVEVMAAVLGYLTKEAGVDVISFAPLSQRAPALVPLRKAVTAVPALRLYRDRSTREHTLLDLPESTDAFVGALSKSRRREYRRDMKRLTAGAPVTARSFETDDVAEAMDRFVAQHQAQWAAQGKNGHFGDWPKAEGFYRALLTRLAPEGAAGLDEIWHGDRMISSQLRFNLGPKAYWWLNARAIDPDYAKVGLGRVALVERIDGLVRAGIRTVDAGAGVYEYKQAYGGTPVPVHEVLIGKSAASLRLKVMTAWADLLHLLYYRIWFLKLAPRLRVPRGPLLRTWVRSRI